MKRAQETPRLEARNVSFAYRRPVVRNASLTLSAGTVTGIIGPNGSGKTTFLRLIGGILRPSSGTVFLDGSCPLEKLSRREIARRIAMVPQTAGTYPFQTVLQFALQGRSPHLPLLGFESERDEELALEALEMTRLTQYLAVMVSELSGGERQRLLLARALTQSAEVLVLDEFTANLDINFQVDLMRLVTALTRRRNLATLVVSHEIHLLSTFCDRIALMTEGSLRHCGSAAEVVTCENLRNLFGLDFTVRLRPDGAREVIPVMHQES